MSAPSWAKGEEPGLIESAAAKIHADVAATRLHSNGTGQLPINAEAARFELSAEERANRSSRPRTRRFKALAKIDEQVDQITQRHAEAVTQLGHAEAALAQAPNHDARTLATWLANGQKGARPSASVYELQRDVDAARLMADAIAVELDGKLDERLAHIEKHRSRMLADAQHAVDQAHKQLLERARELPALRQELVESRETLTWVAAFPSQAQTYGFETAACLGIRKPVEDAIGTAARVEYTSLTGLLELDADTLRSAFSNEQRKQLGQADEATPITQAMWNDDERAVAWRKSELERARAIGEYSSDLNRVADEARDFRS